MERIGGELVQIIENNADLMEYISKMENQRQQPNPIPQNKQSQST